MSDSKSNCFSSTNSTLIDLSLKKNWRNKLLHCNCSPQWVFKCVLRQLVKIDSNSEMAIAFTFARRTFWSLSRTTGEESQLWMIRTQLGLWKRVPLKQKRRRWSDSPVIVQRSAGRKRTAHDATTPRLERTRRMPSCQLSFCKHLATALSPFDIWQMNKCDIKSSSLKHCVPVSIK